MATKKKSKPAAKKKPAKTAAKKPAAPKNKPKPTRAAAAKPAAEEREETGEDEGEAAAGAAPKLKPLTLKQRLALIPRDPVTGKCPHGLMPETCSFCMGI